MRCVANGLNLSTMKQESKKTVYTVRLSLFAPLAYQNYINITKNTEYDKNIQDKDIPSNL